MHDPKEEFWIYVLLSPVDLATANVPGKLEGDLHLQKRVKEVYDMGGNCRNDISMSSFLKCAKDVIYDGMDKVLNCTTPDLVGLFDAGDNLSHKALCKTTGERKKAIQSSVQVIVDFLQNMKKFNCTLPCSTTYYAVR